tara:strand:- start:126 stop:443 length:318 start_codon:yes stop_codon:yes gene_type:complete
MTTLKNGVEILRIRKTEYTDGNKALLMLAKWPDGEVEETPLTVNVAEQAHLLVGDQFFVKNWSENEQFFNDLKDAKIIEPTGLTVPSGYVLVPICTLGKVGQQLL